MGEKRVLVTGIGGNVGQGIIRNIKSTDSDITIVGTNISRFSAGNHLCDAFYLVPYAYEETYISTINHIVEKEGIDLIIPSTDYEVFYLSHNRSAVKCDIVVSESDTTKAFLDKYLTYIHLSENNVPFATSFLPSEYNNEFTDFILKPRKGRGSRGLLINPKEYRSFNDDEYMIQELHKGIEITTAFYVSKKGLLHGAITLERILENGTTTHCKVADQYDSKIEIMLQKLIDCSKINGSANIQSIVTENGDIFPFEINCRISGTNSIRSNFGFEDVKYTLEEYLFNTPPSEPKVKKGIATRVLMDVIYTDALDFNEADDNSAKHFLY